MSLKKVVVASAVLSNGGDAAIALGTQLFFESLLSDALQITWLDDNAHVVSPFYSTELDIMQGLSHPAPLHNFGGGNVGRVANHLRKREVVGRLKQASLVAATGGTYLVDHYTWDRRLVEYQLAKKFGVDIVFLTQSMGPFYSGIRPSAALADILRYARIVMARDDATLSAVRRIAPGCNVLQAPDMAFMLCNLFAPESPSIPTPDGDRPRVAVSVRHWQYFRSGSTTFRMTMYMLSIAAAVSRLVRDDGAEIVFLSTCQGVPGYYDDSALAWKIVRMLEPDVRTSVSVDSGFHKPLELIKKLAGFDAMVGTRMHACILSWIAGTGAVAIAYENKSVELFKRHQLGGLVQDIHDIQASGLLGRVREVLGDGAESGLAARARAEAEATELGQLAVSLSALFSNSSR